MNGFVIAAGSYVKGLTTLAIQTGKAMGPVEVDMGNTACKVPFSQNYIQVAKQRGAFGKKPGRVPSGFGRGDIGPTWWGRTTEKEPVLKRDTVALDSSRDGAGPFELAEGSPWSSGARTRSARRGAGSSWHWET
jgi:hypothetical protein